MATASLADEPFLIDGSWIAPADRARFDVVDPADGEPFARAVQASAADVDAAVARRKTAPAS
jgi:aldehyde dehydrogenase (NAD+)